MKKRVVFGIASVLAFFIFIAAVAFAAGTSAHVVRDHETTTQLLWNEKRAYLVIGMRRDGWSGSQAGYLWQLIAGLLGRPFQFTESKTWLVIADIEPGRVNRTTLDGEMFHFMRPFEGAIYTQFGNVRKWNGQQLGMVPDTEAARFKAAQSSGLPSYSSVDGWSSRINLLNQGNRAFEYTFKLAETPIVVMADRTDPQQPTLKVRGTQRDPVEIISVDQRFRRVSAEEYDLFMHKPLKD